MTDKIESLLNKAESYIPESQKANFEKIKTKGEEYLKSKSSSSSTTDSSKTESTSSDSTASKLVSEGKDLASKVTSSD